jgi:PAS domain S-box-containing protein
MGSNLPGGVSLTMKARPELLDAVDEAAGSALASESVPATLQQVEARNRALLAALPDPMLRIDAEGTYLDVSADGADGLPLQPHELIGRNVRDIVPHAVAEAILGCARQARESGQMRSVDYELELDGVVHSCESRMVPSGDGEVVIIMRDFTERRRADAELQRLAEEQAALRRVATLVARDAAPEQVFQLATEQVCRLLDLRTAVLARFEEGRKSTIVAKFGEPTGAFDVGQVKELEVGSAQQVWETGAPARSNFDEIVGEGAAELRALGFRTSVGVPIAVAGVTWGALVVLQQEGTLPLETERRLQAFAELVGLAVASASARGELAASRQRIVEAGDSERRRIERNLHDGAQQRLVALTLGLRIARAKVRSRPEEAEELLEEFSQELSQAVAELRELAQGIHPAVLTERGLGPALEVLAARAPLAVELDVRLPERLAEPVETASYYVVSEALANVAKHADADTAKVRVQCVDGRVEVEISDNGVGGADADRGSGLRGLRDRVEALDGELWIETAPGRGSLVRGELPVASGVRVAAPLNT